MNNRETNELDGIVGIGCDPLSVYPKLEPMPEGRSSRLKDLVIGNWQEDSEAVHDAPEEEAEGMKDLTRIMVVQQLPVIEEHLHSVKQELLKITDEALQMVCTEQTYKDVKAAKAFINKRFMELEDQRKAVKKAVLSPYEQLELTYVDCVTKVVKECVAKLDVKINAVTEGLKAQKEAKTRAYFEEYRVSLGIEFVTYENAGIVVQMSSTEKKLKAQAKEFLDRVKDDLTLIETQEHKDEILYEYKRSLNVSASITTVIQRHKAIEEETAAREAARKAEEAYRAAEQNVAEVIEEAREQDEAFAPPTAIPQEAPPIEDTPPTVTIYEAAFKVRGDIDQMKALKKFLKEGNYEYEQLKL